MIEERVTVRQWVAVGGAVLGAFMAILDISITNSALRDIQGSLGASLDEGSWISTAYLVAEIMVIPLTGIFSEVFSFRRYLLVNAALFILFSVLCAHSWNLSSMVLFRALQGLTGGVLIPTANTLILTTLPKSKQPIGLALFGIAATFGPSIGPTIGGWLTINYGWEYAFYLNIIPGALLISIIWATVDPTPLKLNLLKGIDWFGLVCMILFLGPLTVVLEEGNRKEWFTSDLIQWLSVLSFAAGTFFFASSLTHPRPIVNLRLFVRRNFFFSSFLILALGVSLYGSIYIVPVYLSSIQNYNALQIGKVLMWVGFPQLLIIPFIPKLLQKFDPRLLIGFGVVMMTTSFWMNTSLTHDYAYDQFRWSQLVRAIGQPFIITPLAVTTYEGIAKMDLGSASGLFNMLRNLGGSIGISMLSTVLTWRYRLHFNRLGEHVTLLSQPVAQRLSTLAAGFVSKGAAGPVAQGQAIQALGGALNREANIMAFIDCFWLMAVSLGLAGLGLFMMRKPRQVSSSAVGH